MKNIKTSIKAEELTIISINHANLLRIIDAIKTYQKSCIYESKKPKIKKENNVQPNK